MNLIISYLRPLPKRLNFVPNCQNIDAFYDYKANCNMKDVCTNLQKLNNDALYEAIACFSKHHYKYRDILYNNLVTLGLIYDEKNTKTSGGYIYGRNLNSISITLESSMYHEVIHLSSTFFDDKESIGYSGFTIDFFNKRVMGTIGEGLTEGYTSLLEHRDKNEPLYMSYSGNSKEPYSARGYLYALVLVEQLEIMLGKDTLEEMFFNKDKLMLFNFFRKYAEDKEILKFYKNVDIATFASNYRSNILNKKVLEAQQFIEKICLLCNKDKIEELRKKQLYKTINPKGYLINEGISEEQEQVYYTLYNEEVRK